MLESYKGSKKKHSTHFIYTVKQNSYKELIEKDKKCLKTKLSLRRKIKL